MSRTLERAQSAWMDEGLSEDTATSRSSRLSRRPSVPVSLVIAVFAWVSLAVWQMCAISFGWVAHDLPEGLVSGEYEIQIVEDAKLGSYGYSAHARVTDALGARRDVLLTYAEDDIDGDARLFAKQKLVAHLSFSELSDASFSRYAAKGICASGKMTKASIAADGGLVGSVIGLRCWARSIFDQIEGKGAALIRAILIGDRSKLEENGLYDDVKTVGLAHMVAVSGAHLSVVAALVGALLSRARVGRFALSVALCLFYGMYAAFTGFSSPVIRAAIMAGVVVSSVWGARRSSSLAALGVCVCLMLATNPANALSLSFFLSAASTLGIVVLSSLMQAWFDALFCGKVRTASRTLALTTAANIPIFPVTACVFSRIPMLSPISNAIAAPAFTFFIGGGLVSLAICAAFFPIGMALLSALSMAADALCLLLAAMARIPFASVPFSMSMWFATIAAGVAFVALWAAWPSPTFVRALAVVSVSGVLAFVCLVVAPLLDPDEIIALDVGQGDAILVKSQGATLLVDTGNQDAMLAAALARAHVAHLDGVVITHHDDDHCASLDSLSSNVSGSSVYVAANTLGCECDGCEQLLSQALSVSGRDAVGLAVGDEVRVGRFTCRVVWPGQFEDEGGNADSLCLLVSRESATGEWKALLTGDAEAGQLEEIASSTGAVDVFKAGHHGSRAGMTETLARDLSAKIALVSCGANNRYGHPAKTTVEALEDAGTAVFRTDVAGDIACVFSQDEIEVRTQRSCEIDLE